MVVRARTTRWSLSACASGIRIAAGAEREDVLGVLLLHRERTFGDLLDLLARQ